MEKKKETRENQLKKLFSVIYLFHWLQWEWRFLQEFDQYILLSIHQENLAEFHESRACVCVGTSGSDRWIPMLTGNMQNIHLWTLMNHPLIFFHETGWGGDEESMNPCGQSTSISIVPCLGLALYCLAIIGRSMIWFGSPKTDHFPEGTLVVVGPGNRDHINLISLCNWMFPFHSFWLHNLRGTISQSVWIVIVWAMDDPLWALWWG